MQTGYANYLLFVDRSAAGVIEAKAKRVTLSHVADQVGACAAALRPIHSLIEAHVLAAERLHGDVTTVPILAKKRLIRAASGLTSGTIGCSEGSHRPRHCSTHRETDDRSILYAT